MSPLTALDVSLSVLTLRVANCEFAVKSGGHGAFYGASNINGGMTIDLVNMTKVSVDAAGLETQVEPGNRWVDVYKYLQPMSLSVIGGRVSDIGVGGLTLGGGISFFSGRYGWACDNVNNYEVSSCTLVFAIRDETACGFHMSLCPVSQNMIDQDVYPPQILTLFPFSRIHVIIHESYKRLTEPRLYSPTEVSMKSTTTHTLTSTSHFAAVATTLASSPDLIF